MRKDEVYHKVQSITCWFETLGVSLLGGTLFFFLHIPLSWMLGPVFAVITWTTFTKRKLRWPPMAQKIGLVVLGYMLGTSFTMQTLKVVFSLLPTLLGVTIILILFCSVMGFLVSRVANIDLPSAIIGSMPGGFSQMIALSEELRDVDHTVVTFMQTIRMMVVIFTVPFITVHGLVDEYLSPKLMMMEIQIQSEWYSIIFYMVMVLGSIWVAIHIRFPVAVLNGSLLGTCLLVVLGVPFVELPSLLIIVAQILIGTHIGVKTNLSNPKSFGKIGMYTLFSNVVIILFVLLLGLITATIFPFTVPTGFLGVAPGGIAEMGITAELVGANLSIVTGFQFFRLLFIMLAIAPFLQWLFNKQRKWTQEKKHLGS